MKFFQPLRAALAWFAHASFGGRLLVFAVVVGALFGFAWFNVRWTLADLADFGADPIPFPLFDAAIAFSALGGAVALLGPLVCRLFVDSPTPIPEKAGSSAPPNHPFGELEGFAKLLALLYFVYEVFAGNLFPTTSVKLTTKLPAAQHAHASDILVNIEIERGDDWLAEIAEAGISQSFADCVDAKIAKQLDHCRHTWVPAHLPGRAGKNPRLAPKEKTSSTVLVPRLNLNDPVTLTAVVVYYSVWWPVPSISFASIDLLSREDGPPEGGDAKSGDEGASE